MSKSWNLDDYTLEDQLRDMVNGRDVVTCDDGTILKGNDDHVDIYWPSDSEKGHGHGGFDFDSDGNIKDYGVYHS